MLMRLKKAYFWLFVVLNIVALASYAFIPDMEPMEITDYLSWVMTPLGLIALFGYAYSHVFYRQWLWVCTAIIILANEVIYGFGDFLITITRELGVGSIEVTDLKYPVVSLLLFVPYYIGITIYAFSKSNWNAT